MPLELVTLPCLADNYAYLLHNAETGQTALIDAPDAAPIQAALAEQGWGLDLILLTHHHWDHIDGVEPLREAFGAKVVGAAVDAHRLPKLDLAVQQGDVIDVIGTKAHVIDVSGHTVGHIAFHLPEISAVFTADSLMALGCGRLFEGTPDQMWQSLRKLRALPADTLVCSGHEYTAGNARFALTVERGNTALQARAAEIAAKRALGEATVPSLLSEEIATNPFLRADLPEVKTAIGMADAGDVAAFAEIRSRKDRF
jgi:hydroxyacylglutathione hydrolase